MVNNERRNYSRNANPAASDKAAPLQSRAHSTDDLQDGELSDPSLQESSQRSSELSPRHPYHDSKQNRRRSPSISHGPFRRYVIGSLIWPLNLYRIKTLFMLFLIPIALVLTYSATYWLYESLLGMTATTVTIICVLPGSTHFGFCPIPPPPKPERTPPFFQKGLDFGSKLVEMQKVGANSVELPYYLQMSEGSVRSMIIQLSAVDLPSKDKLMPLLKEYQHLVDKAIDGIQDTLARIDQSVDATIHINSWAAYELEQIEDRHSSPLEPVKSLLRNTGLIIGAPTTEVEVRQTFVGMTDRVQNNVGKVLVDMRIQGETLRELRDVLENIAIFVLGDKEKLKREKMNQHSYWKFIFRSYRDKMSDFDNKMEICASFYDHVEKAYSVVSNTKFKMQQMRGELILFRDKLQEAPLALQEGRKGSLQLYINMLNSGVENLEGGRNLAKSLKDKKMKLLEQKMKY